MNYYFHKLLAEHIVKVHNAGHKNLTPVQVHKGYTNAHDFSVFDGLNTAIADFKRMGWITVSMKTEETVKGIKIVPEYISVIAQQYELVTRETYVQDVTAMLALYETHNNTNIKHFVALQKELLSAGKLANFSKIGYTSRLQDVLSAANALDAQVEDITLRELSIRIFNDSKKLESLVTDALCVLGESEESIDDALKAHHVSRNPAYATIKGKAVLCFDNNETLNLGHFKGPVQLSKDFVDKIKEIQTDCVLTVENLTSFEQGNDESCFYIYTGGYANNLVVSMINKIRVPVQHFGDMDANGFKILHNLSERTNKTIQPYQMDIDIANKYIQYGKPISEFNRKELTRMMSDNRYSEREKQLFAFLLEHNITLEQEIIPINRKD